MTFVVVYCCPPVEGLAARMTRLQLSLSSTDLAASLIRSLVQSLIGLSSLHRLLGRPYLCSLERSHVWCPSLNSLLSSLHVRSSSASIFLCELTVTSPLLALIVPIRLFCDLSTKLSILFGSSDITWLKTQQKSLNAKQITGTARLVHQHTYTYSCFTRWPFFST